MTTFEVRPAREEDCAEVSRLIHALAAYEKLADQCESTPELIREALFGEKRGAHCNLLWAKTDEGERPVGFSLYFHCCPN